MAGVPSTSNSSLLTNLPTSALAHIGNESKDEFQVQRPNYCTNNDQKIKDAENEENSEELKNTYSPSLFFQDIEHYKCPVCHEIAKDPRNMPCGHLLCNNCYTQLLRKICPLCRAELPHSLDTCNYLYHEIGRLKMRCPNHEVGCTETYTLGADHKSNQKNHLRNCKYRKKKCVDCRQLVSIIEMDKHIEICCCRETECPCCHEIMTRQQLQVHLDDADQHFGCPNMGHCPLKCKTPKGSPTVISVFDRKKHLHNECPKRSIRCELCLLLLFHRKKIIPGSTSVISAASTAFLPTSSPDPNFSDSTFGCEKVSNFPQLYQGTRPINCALEPTMDIPAMHERKLACVRQTTESKKATTEMKMDTEIKDNINLHYPSSNFIYPHHLCSGVASTLESVGLKPGGTDAIGLASGPKLVPSTGVEPIQRCQSWCTHLERSSVFFMADEEKKHTTNYALDHIQAMEILINVYKNAVDRKDCTIRDLNDKINLMSKNNTSLRAQNTSSSIRTLIPAPSALPPVAPLLPITVYPALPVHGTRRLSDVFPSSATMATNPRPLSHMDRISSRQVKNLSVARNLVQEVNALEEHFPAAVTDSSSGRSSSHALPFATTIPQTPTTSTLLAPNTGLSTAAQIFVNNSRRFRPQTSAYSSRRTTN